MSTAYQAHRAAGTKSRCRAGKVRHTTTLPRAAFDAIKASAIANGRSVSEEMAARLVGDAVAVRPAVSPVLTEIVERVARAIYQRWAANRGVSDSWESVCRLGHSIADEARQEAADAIAAMRVPTIGMLVAAHEEWTCVRAAEDRGAVIWRAMIDAALTSTEGWPR